MNKKQGDSSAIAGQTSIAVALQYDEDSSGAPRVTAKGEQATAERIIELAEQHDVPLYPDKELAATLVQIPLGNEVPENLYRAVAEVISFAYLLAGKMPKGFDPEETADG